MNSTNQEAKLKTLPGPWTLGEMTGNWRDIDLPDHGGVMRIVWKMEDDEGRNEELEAQAHAVVAALNAASPTPPAERKAKPCADMRRLHDLLYATQRQTTFDAAHGAITAARIELSNLMAASPTTAEQQAATEAALGGVYAELPVPNYPKSGGFPGTFTEVQMRDFADRTHALRMEQAAPKAEPVKACVCGEPQASGTVHRVDGPCYVAAPKAAPGEPTQEMVDAVMSLVDLEVSDPEDHRYDDGSKLAAQICRAVLALAPQQEVSQDTMYLLRRLLSNQHTLTGPEFRAELEKIVGEAYQQETHDGGSCADGNTPGLMPADAELLAHIKKAVPGLTRVNTALMVAKAVLEKFGSRRVASEVK